MRSHPRIRKTVKWGGFLVGLLLLMAWGATSRGLHFGWDGASRSGMISVELSRGAFTVFWSSQPPMHVALPYARWSFGAHDEGYLWIPYWHIGAGYVSVCIPLWLPWVIAFAAAFLAWRLDLRAARRARFISCAACGYSRAGLATGTPCPECGQRNPVRGEKSV